MLGAILVNNDAYHQVSGFLRADHFHEPVHGRIYEASSRLIEAGKRADPVTLAPRFAHDEALTEAGGAGFIGRLAASAVTFVHAEDYGRIIHDMALRRRLISTAEAITAAAHDEQLTTDALLAEAERKFIEATETSSGGYQQFADFLDESVQHTEKVRAGEISPGLMTGLPDLDRYLGGFGSGDFVIVAGRPSIGKSLFGQTIAVNVAREGLPVGLISLEMQGRSLAHRALGAASGVSYAALRRGQVEDGEMRRVAECLPDLKQLPIWVDAERGQTMAAIRARARKLKRRKKIKLLIVDYLQLVAPQDRYKGNMVAETTEISNGIKTLAGELDIPIIALSQLSRAVEVRTDKHPMLADLRASGALEQDADVVLGLYREHAYQKEPPERADKRADWEEKTNILEVGILKQRNGPLKWVDLYVNLETGLVAGLER
ncbi:MAG: replicative DNA helicase [Paracoccaceae bacterium]